MRETVGDLWWDGMRMSKREDGRGDSERRRLKRARTTGRGVAARAGGGGTERAYRHVCPSLGADWVGVGVGWYCVPGL